MSDLTDYYEALIIEHSFDGADMPTAPSTVYVALHDADPTNSGEANELSGGGYARVDVETDTGFTITGNEAENAAAITFPTATADWGTVTHFSVWDGSDPADNALWQSELDDPILIEENDELRFNAGGITAEVN